MFTYYQPTKIHFGENRLEEVGKIAKKYGSSCFMVSTPDAPLQPLYERIKALLNVEGIKVVHFDKVEPNPSATMIEEGFQLLKQNPCDFVLAVGGGSSIDSAKALAFTNGQEKLVWEDLFAFDSPFKEYEAYSNTVLPIISVPTTSGTGSQVTQASVITRGDEKITFYHPSLFSKECILDSTLTLTLPTRITAATGFDAFTHAFESFINPRASVYSEMDSLKAMELIIENLPKALADPQNIEYRKKMSMADTLAGRALANSGACAPHPLSEIIGGIKPMPHGEALAIVFPSFIKHAYKDNQEKMNQVAKLFGKEDLQEAMIAFLQEINMYKTLQDCDVDEETFAKIIACPILDFLPFGNRAFLETILKESYA